MHVHEAHHYNIMQVAITNDYELSQQHDIVEYNHQNAFKIKY